MAKCPYCKEVVTLEKTNREMRDHDPITGEPETVHREVMGVIKKEIMYSCPHCDSVLGFGFFFGGLLTHRP
jgi:phage FluMu protein Com